MEQRRYDADLDIVMTGEESYPIKSFLPSNRHCSTIEAMTPQFKGLPRYAGCLEKNKIMWEKLGGTLVLGRMFVLSAENGGMYRFEFNLPYEFHAWVILPNKDIIDASLPGVIERGMKMEDEMGPIIEGRSPFILAGEAPKWINYQPVIDYHKMN